MTSRGQNLGKHKFQNVEKIEIIRSRFGATGVSRRLYIYIYIYIYIAFDVESDGGVEKCAREAAEVKMKSKEKTIICSSGYKFLQNKLKSSIFPFKAL